MMVAKRITVIELTAAESKKKKTNIWWRNGGETGGETDAQKFAPQEIFGDGGGTEKRLEKRMPK